VTSIVARTANHVIVPVIIVMSVYLLLRVHDAPGGGFIAALVAGAGIILRRFLEPEVRARSGNFVGWLAAGLVIGVAAGLAGVALTGSFLGPRIWTAHLPLLGEVKVTLSLIFDIGVYLVVIAVIRAVIDELGARR
jgi:multicomponent Na+:H+ antiporter subunit A